MRDPTEADVVFCRMKTETAKNLLPCPFCGSKVVLYASLLPVDSSLFHARCTGCMSESGIYESIEQVEQAWNRRVGDTDASGQVAEAKKMHWGMYCGICDTCARDAICSVACPEGGVDDGKTYEDDFDLKDK